MVLFSSSERAQAGVVRVTSSALPSASVRRVAVKPSPLTVTVHALDRAGLTGRKGLDAENSGVLHGDTLLCW